jgi:very-short-patch-repair endonuclease
MTIDYWIEANRNSFGSEYETIFARNVLPLVKDLDLKTVAAQYAFKDKDGRQRYCDFVIVESDEVRLAIEIDGYDKLGTGMGMSHAQFLDWQRRQASLAAQGWHVLRFANRDVRDNPERCAEYINQLLSKLRSSANGRVEIIKIQGGTFDDVDCRPSQPSPPVKKTNTYSTMGIGLLATVVALGLWLELSGRPTGQSEYAPSSQAHKPVSTRLVRASDAQYGALDCRNAVDWTEAHAHVGQLVTIAGPFLASTAKPDASGSPLWLDVGGRFPDKRRLTGVVWGRNWSNFDLQMLDAGQWHQEAGRLYVCLSGKVALYKGVPQVEVVNPNQILIGYK